MRHFGNHNLLTVTDADSALTMTYDLANRLLTTATAGSSNQPSVTLSYAYDRNGNRTLMTDPVSSASYGYDTLNRLTYRTVPSACPKGDFRSTRRSCLPSTSRFIRADRDYFTMES